MADRIETEDELRRVVRDEADAGRMDVRAKTTSLRDSLGVGDAVRDWEIQRVVTEALRSDRNPEVVFALGGGLLVAHIQVPVDGDLEVDDELWSVERTLSGLHGGKVWLSPAPASARGYGIVTAYRMPTGDYGPEDWHLVERFGVEIGKYQQSRERVAV